MVRVLLTDDLMPVMTGEELAKRAPVARPNLPVLIMTGHGNALAAVDPVWWAAARHLEKPFCIKALSAAVESLIG